MILYGRRIKGKFLAVRSRRCDGANDILAAGIDRECFSVVLLFKVV